MNSLQIVKLSGELALSKKAYDVKILDLKKITQMADYFLICSADVEVQVRAIADEIENGLKQNGEIIFKREGDQFANWIILDYVDVVIHIMKKDIRQFYNIESLWGDAKIKLLKEKIKKSKTKKTKKIK